MSRRKTPVEKAVDTILLGNSVALKAYESLNVELERELFVSGLHNLYLRGVVDEKESQLNKIHERIKDGQT